MAELPSFGWTLLSRDAIKKAEAQLQPGFDGVRDEIGFLAVHQAYSDHFFPGTSVLHTRLRYVLFVPWIYQRVAAHSGSGNLARHLTDEELRLAGRLKESGEEGVIGGRIYPKKSAQPPNMVYWSALAAWGLTMPRADGSIPSRTDALRTLASSTRSRSRGFDDDRQPLESEGYVFITVPEPPSEWEQRDLRLTFRLTAPERRFLRARLAAVRKPDGTGPALLSRLADQGVDVSAANFPWSSPVAVGVDSEEKAMLMRARQAAALSAIGRAVYASLVEARREADRQPTDNVHRTNLDRVRRDFRDLAAGLDLKAVSEDAPRMAADPIMTVLEETQRWLKRTASPRELEDIYTEAEHRRKGVRRSRLGAMPVNRERRLEWVATEHPKAQPLHYRWDNVKRLLLDLQGAE